MCLPFERQAENKRRWATAPHFWSHFVGVLYGLERTMSTRDTSKVIGPKARGEGRERGNLIDLIETTVKPPLAQRVGGI